VSANSTTAPYLSFLQFFLVANKQPAIL